ncbi:MAG: restriction endonuclease subunit S [Fermentimonas sp.]|nr:restriction endonuclease subunit S [Fermentimonas sp.]
MSFKAYPDYMDVGLDWIESIPKHWLVKPNRALFVESNITNRDNEKLLSVTISKGIITQEELLNSSSKKDSSNLDKSKYKLVEPNDIAYNKMRAWQGAIGVSKFRGIVSPAYIIHKPKVNICPDYYHYLFRSASMIKVFEKWSYGITSDQWSLRPEHFRLINCILPPYEEQEQIAHYLDYKNHLINKYIRIKKKQIELLKELKQVVINDAVTGKIDVRTGKTYPKYKDSGIDWMGMIPEEWEVNRLKRISSIRYGLGQPPKEKETGLPLIRATNVKSGNIVANDLLLVDSADVPLSRDAFLKKDEIIVVRSGALTGDSAIIPDKYVGAVAGYDMVVSVYESCPQFIAYVLLSNYLLQDQLYLLKSRAAQPHLNSGELGGLLILTPTTEIQHIIVTYIDQLLKKIDHHIQTINAEISLILEFRTTLISDVVTGKLDVRSIEIPDFEEEPEDIEDGIIDDILEEAANAD